MFPIVSLYFLAALTPYFCIIQYTRSRWEEEVFSGDNEKYKNDSNATICTPDQDDKAYQLANEVDKKASEWNTFYSIASGVPGVFSNLILGSYTDAFGRKFLFTVGITGTMLRAIIGSIVVHFKLDLIYIVVAFILEGITGYYVTTLQVSMAYIADITTSGKSRTVGIVAVEFSLGVSFTLAGFLGNFLIEDFGFFYPMVGSSAVQFSALFIVVTLLPETHSTERRRTNKGLLETLCQSVRFYTSKASNFIRAQYILLISIFIFNSLGFLGTQAVLILYQMGSPFCWSPKQVAYYGAIFTATQCFIGLPSVKLLQRIIKDVFIVIIGVTSSFAGQLLTAFAHNDLMLYLVPAVSVFGPLPNSLIRSMMSQMTSSDKQGALFSSISAVEIICNLLSNTTSNAVYTITVSVYRGFVFFLLAGFNGIGLVLLMVLLVVMRAAAKQIQL